MTEFEAFWAEFPRKTGKLAAIEKFKQARKIASVEDIMAGVRRYVVSKPEYADWCHPKTWLSQGRWMDEPDRRVGGDRRAHQPEQFAPDLYAWQCPHTPRCGNRSTCRVVAARQTP